MKLWKYLLPLPSFLCLLLSFFSFWFSNDLGSDLDRELIDRVQMGKRSRQVYRVQSRKLKIYKEHKIGLSDFLTYEAISQVECWHPLWICKNGTYVWPFQIYNWDYKEFNIYYNSKDYNSLFAFSLWWVVQKQERNKHYYSEVDTIKEKVRAVAKIHNGNNNNIGWCNPYKECFADKVRLVREQLKNIYLNKY